MSMIKHHLCHSRFCSQHKVRTVVWAAGHVEFLGADDAYCVRGCGSSGEHRNGAMARRCTLSMTAALTPSGLQAGEELYYRGTMDAWRKIYHDEGPAALYKVSSDFSARDLPAVSKSKDRVLLLRLLLASCSVSGKHPERLRIHPTGQVQQHAELPGMAFWTPFLPYCSDTEALHMM